MLRFGFKLKYKILFYESYNKKCYISQKWIGAYIFVSFKSFIFIFNLQRLLLQFNFLYTVILNIHENDYRYFKHVIRSSKNI